MTTVEISVPVTVQGCITVQVDKGTESLWTKDDLLQAIARQMDRTGGFRSNDGEVCFYAAISEAESGDLGFEEL